MVAVGERLGEVGKLVFNEVFPVQHLLQVTFPECSLNVP
jgi:hypothetical protein